jgi:dTDP-4-amino-4,6-dideoxygalactose transaminase
MKNINVPFQDLYAQFKTIKSEINFAINNTIKNSTFVRGVDVDIFEKRFATMNDMKFCISCANGTDALYIAMKSLNLSKNDEVIVPAMSWISSSESVTQAGAKIVFCDVLPGSLNIDPEDFARKVTRNTVGVIVVHLYGQPAALDKIISIAKNNKLWVIEDCAQAHFATFKGKKVGNFGLISTFSFYPGKNLGAMGDGGAILTNNKVLSESMQRFARHGGLFKGEHKIEGINSRLDGMQAAILNVKLRYIKLWTKRRQEIAELYNSNLSKIEEIEIPIKDPNIEHVWHLYVIKVKKNRDKLAQHLKAKNIATNINYPKSLPFLDAYKKYRHKKNDFPVAYRYQSQILSLPMYPEMSTSQILHVIKSIKAFYK